MAMNEHTAQIRRHARAMVRRAQEIAALPEDSADYGAALNAVREHVRHITAHLAALDADERK